jgi:hypothetical protein
LYAVEYVRDRAFVATAVLLVGLGRPGARRSADR